MSPTLCSVLGQLCLQAMIPKPVPCVFGMQTIQTAAHLEFADEKCDFSTFKICFHPYANHFTHKDYKILMRILLYFFPSWEYRNMIFLHSLERKVMY